MTPTPTLTIDEGETAPTRQRLLCQGLRLFALKGYPATSTREIADAAHTNVASISYHFGDKAGLYRAVFFEPLGAVEDDLARFTDPGFTLVQALQAFYEAMLEPMRQGDAMRQCVTLRFREILEPTGLWDEEIRQNIAPLHGALVAVLARHLGADPSDLELHRLSICITSLVVHLMMAEDVINGLAPELLARPGHLDEWIARLTTYAAGMVAAEAARRGQPK